MFGDIRFGNPSARPHISMSAKGLRATFFDAFRRLWFLHFLLLVKMMRRLQLQIRRKQKNTLEKK